MLTSTAISIAAAKRHKSVAAPAPFDLEGRRPTDLAGGLVPSIVAILLTAFLGGSVPAAECVGRFVEDFEDGSLQSLWIVTPPDFSFAAGDVSEFGGRLYLSKAHGHDGAGPGVRMDPADYVVCGDFDIRVDYELAEFDVVSGERMAGLQLLSADGTTHVATVERYNRPLGGSCNPAEENYKAWTSTSSNCDPSVAWAPTGDRSGRLRITRTGTLYTMYYWDAGWVPLKSAGLSGGPVTVHLFSSASGELTSHGVRYDNLLTQSSEPPGAGAISSLVLDIAPDDELALAWDDSCDVGDGDFEIYEGTLEQGGFADHQLMTCSTGGSTNSVVSPATGDTYYLVVPRTLHREGSYGRSSSAQRPQGTPFCLERRISECAALPNTAPVAGQHVLGPFVALGSYALDLLSSSLDDEDGKAERIVNVSPLGGNCQEGQGALTTVQDNSGNTVLLVYEAPDIVPLPCSVSFSYQVVDSMGALSSDIGSAEYSLLPNEPPVANAGDDISGSDMNPLLIATCSTDPDNGMLSYHWSIVNQPLCNSDPNDLKNPFPLCASIATGFPTDPFAVLEMNQQGWHKVKLVVADQLSYDEEQYPEVVDTICVCVTTETPPKNAGREPASILACAPTAECPSRPPPPCGS